MDTHITPGTTLFLEGSYPVKYDNQPPFYPQSVIFLRAEQTGEKIKVNVRMGHLPCIMEMDELTFAGLPVVKGEDFNLRP